jgi:hypothetical protein
MEEWKIISFCEEFSVSNMGRVKYNINGRILKANNNGGYLRISLKKKQPYIHKLVAEAFLPNLDNYTECDHINRDKTDNRVCNLRWINRSNNCRNKSKKENSTSKYKGVSYTRSNTWNACGYLNGKRIHIGNFNNEEDAGCAYNDWVIKNEDIKDFCVLNDIN